MKRNVGIVDRVLRIVVGLVLIAFAIPIGFSNLGWNWVGWVGVIPVLTGLVGSCPLYQLFGLSSCPLR